MKYTLALTLLAAADAGLPAHPPPLAGVQQAGFEVPATCAFLYGDPHILTWDHQHADCMSDGDFLMAKSSDSDFEIQSRFYEASEEMQEMHFREKGWRVGTGTKAIVINTGVPGEPIIEIDAEVPKTNAEGKTWDSKGDFVGCQLKYYVDGKRVYLDNVDEIGDNVIFERTKAVEKNIWGSNMVTNHYRNFYFKESGVFLQVTKKYWDRFGCFMNAKICVPESVTKQNLYGLLGNANGSKGDDFETKFGKTLSTNINKKNYCEENWCVKDDAESMFFEPTILDGCQQDHREELEEAVKNASDEIKEKCEDDLDCIEDAIITGDIDFGIRTLEEKKKALENEVVGGTVDEDDDEEGICVTAEGSPVNCDSYDYEFVCEAVDYDFGLRMEGCDGDADGAFQGLFLTDNKPTCSVENYDLGTFGIDCSADGKDATITPAVDTVVKVSGSTKGMLYTGLKAGQTYTLTSAKGDKKEAIENIEFCFKCPKSIVDGEIVACAADVQTCPGDIALSRNPSDNCNFPACPPVPEVKTVAPCDAMREHTKCGYNNAARTFKKSGQTLEECQKACADDAACLFYSHQEVGPHAGVCMGCKGDSDAQTDYHEDFNFYPKDCLNTKTEKEIVEETEGVPADYGDCEEMYEDHKCPWQHEDRTHRIEDLTIDECYQACIDDPECMHWSYSREGDANGNFANVCMGCNATVNKHVHIGFNLYSMCPEARQPKEPEPEVKPAPPKTPGSGSGDPHFKTWTGDKYDYHGECDLVLLDHPSFKNGLGLKVHIRTTRVKYFSYIESVAVQIGDEVLEFDNDVDNFLINGEKVGENQKHHKTMLSGFVVRRDTKAISIRLYDHGAEARHNNVIAKIDLHTRKNGFPAVIVDGGHTDVFKGSLGLLGDWATGEKVGRDGKTVFEVDPENAEDFALEWQVRDNEPTLFKEARFPQFPATCTPPVKMNKGRLGMDKAKKEAEEACAHWQEDKEDCIFDVIATRDVLVAEEGHIVQME